ncbi:MAG: hypothetical protein ACQEUM_07060 [Pseudomonadota bacterium]
MNRAEQIRDQVYDGHPAAVAAFAQSLAEAGELGGCMEITAETTAGQMVDHYLKTIVGQLALSEWAEAVAADEEREAAMRRAA